MNHRIARWVLAMLVGALALGVTAYAQSSLVLSRPIVANGGGVLISGVYTLIGAIGQSEAHVLVQSGVFLSGGGGLAGDTILLTPTPLPTTTATTIPTATPTISPTLVHLYLPVLAKP